MRSARHLTYLSPEDYLAGELVAQTKHEYVDGEVYAMVGVSKAHARIVANIGAALHGQLRRPCGYFLTEVKVRVEAANAYYYPDVVVACDPTDVDPYVIARPAVVVEVLSPSTAALDRREKRVNYQKIPSVREILLVGQDERVVEVYRRDGDGWMLETVRDEGAVALESVGVELTLDAIYGDPP